MWKLVADVVSDIHFFKKTNEAATVSVAKMKGCGAAKPAETLTSSNVRTTFMHFYNGKSAHHLHFYYEKSLSYKYFHCKTDGFSDNFHCKHEGNEAHGLSVTRPTFGALGSNH